MNDRHIANSKSREQAILLVLVICSSMSYCSATNIYFPGGFHDSRYHASLEISRSDYSTTHLNVWTHGYVIMRWSMQTALGHCRSSSGTLWHYLKLYPCTEKAHDCIFHRINDFWFLESYKTLCPRQCSLTLSSISNTMLMMPERALAKWKPSCNRILMKTK